jgi:hypothetical protein
MNQFRDPSPEDHPWNSTPETLMHLVTQPSITQIFDPGRPGQRIPSIIQCLREFGRGNPILDYYQDMTVASLTEHAAKRKIHDALIHGLDKNSIITAIQKHDAEEMISAVLDVNSNLSIMELAEIESEDFVEGESIIRQLKDFQREEAARDSIAPDASKERQHFGQDSTTLTDRLSDGITRRLRLMESREPDTQQASSSGSSSSSSSGLRHMGSQRLVTQQTLSFGSATLERLKCMPDGSFAYRASYPSNSPKLSLHGPSRKELEERRLKSETTFPKVPMMFTPERDGEGYCYKDQTRHRRGAVAMPAPVPPIPTFSKTENDWKKPETAGSANSQRVSLVAHQPSPSDVNTGAEHPAVVAPAPRPDDSVSLETMPPSIFGPPASRPDDSVSLGTMQPSIFGPPQKSSASSSIPEKSGGLASSLWAPPGVHQPGPSRPLKRKTIPHDDASKRAKTDPLPANPHADPDDRGWDPPSPKSGPAAPQVQSQDQDEQKDLGRRSLRSIHEFTWPPEGRSEAPKARKEQHERNDSPVPGLRGLLQFT